MSCTELLLNGLNTFTSAGQEAYFHTLTKHVAALKRFRNHIISEKYKTVK